MRDYLVRVSSLTAAKTALAAWATKDEAGKDTWRLPTWCDILPVDAYSSMGTPATMDADGNVTDPGTPPILATGKWFIVSLDRDVTLPAAANAAIKAQADRDDGLTLPAGVAGLSQVWAGMRVV